VEGIPQWEESDSARFIRYGAVFTPSRDEQLAMLVALTPAEVDEPFTAVDLGCGAGPLTMALLAAFPKCRVIAMDGSDLMLQTVRERCGEANNRLNPVRGDLRSRVASKPSRLCATDCVIAGNPSPGWGREASVVCRPGRSTGARRWRVYHRSCSTGELEGGTCVRRELGCDCCCTEYRAGTDGGDRAVSPGVEPLRDAGPGVRQTVNLA
jgi:hypothetical protein